MLGVLPEYRDRGVGRMLKLRQREDALARSIDLIEWTFDPLELKNAYFNIERLGAVVRRYVLNQYGTTSSPLHGSLPTDRCVAEWWLASGWVEDTLAGRRVQRPEVRARISIPAEAVSLRTEDPKRAREIQRAASDQFLENFSKGLTVTGLERSEAAGTYLFGVWDSE
jgi:predicted GNAT superfamily acetyltransferase